MSDDSRGDELGDLDDALFGDGSAKPAPAREPSPSSDIDWFAGIDDESAVPLAATGAAAAADLTSELMPEPASEPPFEAPFDPLPDLASTPPSLPVAEGPIVDAAIFGMSGEPTPQPLSRRELHARPPVPRRRRVITLLVVLGLLTFVGIGVAAVVTSGGEGSVAKSQVKIVGTALPTTTASTRPVTTLSPATVAPTIAATTPPATARASSGAATTPARTNPPATDPEPPATDPPPPPTDPTTPPTTTTEPPTTTTTPTTTTEPPTTTT